MSTRQKIITIIIIIFGVIIVSFFTILKPYEDKKESIELVQKANIEENALINTLEGVKTYGDLANQEAKENPNTKYKWDSEKTTESGVYLVSFTDEKGWGSRWEVNIKENIVRYINNNEYLSRKYGFTRVSQEGEFTVSEQFTLKIEKHYDYLSDKNSKVVVCEIDGSVINNTDKVITSADIEGIFMLIFKDKTVKGVSNCNGLFSSDCGFTKKVSESNPWRPKESREFTIKTKGISNVYLNYQPPYVVFDIALNAKDPIGYKFNKYIYEQDLKEEWEKLRKENN
jgi:hypothetical protein